MPSKVENIEQPEMPEEQIIHLSHSTSFTTKLELLNIPLFCSGIPQDRILEDVILVNDDNRLVHAKVYRPTSQSQEDLLRAITFYGQDVPELPIETSTGPNSEARHNNGDLSPSDQSLADRANRKRQAAAEEVMSYLPERYRKNAIATFYGQHNRNDAESYDPLGLCGRESAPADMCQIMEHVLFHNIDNTLTSIEANLLRAVMQNQYVYNPLMTQEELNEMTADRNDLRLKIAAFEQELKLRAAAVAKDRSELLREWAKQDKFAAQLKASKKPNVFKRLYNYLNKKNVEKKRIISEKLAKLEMIHRKRIEVQYRPETYLAKEYEKLEDMKNQENDLNLRIVSVLAGSTLKNFVEVAAGVSVEEAIYHKPTGSFMAY